MEDKMYRSTLEFKSGKESVLNSLSMVDDVNTDGI